MDNLDSYFENLQFAVNILTSIDWRSPKTIQADLSSVADALFSLDFKSLLSELSDRDGHGLFEKYSQQNHLKCNRDRVVSFLDYGENEINSVINMILEKSPIHKKNEEIGNRLGNVCAFEILKVLADEFGSLEDGFTDTECIRCLYLEKRDELFIACGLTPNPETTPEQEQTVSKLPPELDTPKAHIIWSKAKHNGWINDDYSFNGTKYQMAYAAECMAGELKLKPKWRPFEILWKYKYFSQTRRESKERFGKVDRQKEIETTFSL